MRSPKLLLGVSLLGILSLRVRAEDFVCTEAQLKNGCQQEARYQLQRREGRWLPIQETLEAMVGNYPEVVLVAPAGAEEAFQSYHKRAAYLGEKKGVLPKLTREKDGSGSSLEPSMADIIGTKTTTLTAEQEELVREESLGILTQDEVKAGLDKVSPEHMFLRVRAQIKTETIMDQNQYGKVVPLQGFHPFQIWLLSERVAGGEDLAVHRVLAKLGDLFATAPLAKVADGLGHALVQGKTEEMLLGYASYRYHRAYPGLDEQIAKAALEKLRSMLPREETGEPVDVFFQSLFDMLLACHEGNAERPGRVVDLLFAVFVDYQMTALGLANRIEWTDASRRQDSEEDGEGRRLLRALTLDPVFQGANLRFPEKKQEAWTSPFGELSTDEHLRRLAHFSDRLKQAKEKVSAAMKKVGEGLQMLLARERELGTSRTSQPRFSGTSTASSARWDESSFRRLIEEVSRLTFGRDPDLPDADSIVGIVSSPEFQAERRYLLAQGPSKDLGVQQAYRRIFGEGKAEDQQGDYNLVMVPLQQSILPFLRRGGVGTGRLSASTPDEILAGRQALDRMRDRLEEIDAELWRLQGMDRNDPRVREAIQSLERERADLIRDYDRQAKAMTPSSPSQMVDRYRQVAGWLESGRVPDGKGGTRALTSTERASLEREASSLRRELMPTAEEARQRAAELDDLLAKNQDLRGQTITDPKVRDEIREERDRMRAIARGEQVLPAGVTSSDRDLFTGGRTSNAGISLGERDGSWREWSPSREAPTRLSNGNPQTVDPNTGRRIDPVSGRQVNSDGSLGDRATGQPINPVTGRPADPKTGRDLPIDSATGNPVNSDGYQVNPRTGEVLGKAQGTLIDRNTGAQVSSDGTRISSVGEGLDGNRDSSWKNWSAGKLGNGNPQTVDPNTGNRIDPVSGRQINSDGSLGGTPTAQPINPVTGRAADPTTGRDLPIDSKTGNPVNASGNQIDPVTGAIGPKAEGTLVDPSTLDPVTTSSGSAIGTASGGTAGTSTDTSGVAATNGASTSTSSGTSSDSAPAAAETSPGLGTATSSATGTATETASGTPAGTSAATSAGDGQTGKTEPAPPRAEDLDAWAHQELTKWMATNGGNSFGLPPGASTSEIQSMLQAEANKKAPAGLSYNERGQLVGRTSSGTIRSNGSPDGDLWPAEAKAAVAAILTQRIEAKRQEYRAQAEQKFGSPAAGSGPSSTAAGR